VSPEEVRGVARFPSVVHGKDTPETAAAAASARASASTGDDGAGGAAGEPARS
jgi:hypothetical protein